MEDLKKHTSQEKRDAVELLYNNSFSGLVVSAITSCALVFSFQTEQIQILKYYWLALLFIVLIIRSIDLIHWQKNFSKDSYNYQSALVRFNVGVTVTAVLWCSYIFIVAGKVQIIELAASLIAISGMAGGAATVLAGSMYAATSYCGILLIPSSLYLIFLNDFSTELFGGLGLMFASVIIVIAKNTSEFTQNAIRLKNNNRLLVEEMESEVVKRTDEIHKLSNIDPLTKLYNRSAFSITLAELLFKSNRTGQQTAILFIDLDGFKQVNDAFGHEIGDKVLRFVSKRPI